MSVKEAGRLSVMEQLDKIDRFTIFTLNGYNASLI